MPRRPRQTRSRGRRWLRRLTMLGTIVSAVYRWREAQVRRNTDRHFGSGTGPKP